MNKASRASKFSKVTAIFLAFVTIMLTSAGGGAIFTNFND